MIWIGSVCCRALWCAGQEQPVYQPIPADFRTGYLDLYRHAVSRIGDTDRRIRKAKSEFYEESYYYQSHLMLSGKVLFNDPAGEYAGSIVRYLLRDHPDLQAEIRCYTVRSPAVNAFATTNGLILVNLGLLARVENEAQLAFILCHEIGHYIRQHPLDLFLEARRLDQSADRPLADANWEEVILAKNAYSREKEEEADLIGLDLFLQSGYSLEGAWEVFDMLQEPQRSAYAPPLAPSYLVPEGLQLPDSLWLSEVQDLAPAAGEDVTHPDPARRKGLIRARINGMPPGARQDWIIGEGWFWQIQHACRLECCRMLLDSREYEKALYYAYTLKDTDPAESDRLASYALYGLARYAMQGKWWDVHVPYEEAEGEVQRICYLTEQLAPHEMALLSLAFVRRCRQSQPGSVLLERMYCDLRQDLQTRRRDSARLLPDSSWLSPLWARLADSPAWAPCEPLQAEEAPDKGSFSLGGDNILLLNPVYRVVDERSGSRVRYLESELAEQRFAGLLRQHIETAGIGYSWFSAHQLKPEDAGRFEDMVRLNAYVLEQQRMRDAGMVSLHWPEVQAIGQRHGARYLVWSGALALVRPRPAKGMVMAAGLAFFPMFPYSLYYALTPRHDTMLLLEVYDLETGRQVFGLPRLVRMDDRADVLNALTYDLVQRIK
ncbi:MAG: M48 family metalloprotease [Bacteroidia bacterium]|nr:M48 family metalloprotease [Bacteroidia bacterium]